MALEDEYMQRLDKIIDLMEMIHTDLLETPVKIENLLEEIKRAVKK